MVASRSVKTVLHAPFQTTERVELSSRTLKQCLFKEISRPLSVWCYSVEKFSVAKSLLRVPVWHYINLFVERNFLRRRLSRSSLSWSRSMQSHINYLHNFFADLSWAQFQTTLLPCSPMMWGRQNKRKLKWRVLILRRCERWFILHILVSICIPLADYLNVLFAAEVSHSPQFFINASGENINLQTQTNCLTFFSLHRLNIATIFYLE